MLTQEEIDNWDVGYETEKSDFEKIKKDLHNCLESIEAAEHWLHSTGDYESQDLDDALGHLKDARHIMKLFLKRESS